MPAISPTSGEISAPRAAMSAQVPASITEWSSATARGASPNVLWTPAISNGNSGIRSVMDREVRPKRRGLGQRRAQVPIAARIRLRKERVVAPQQREIDQADQQRKNKYRLERMSADVAPKGVPLRRTGGHHADRIGAHCAETDPCPAGGFAIVRIAHFRPTGKAREARQQTADQNRAAGARRRDEATCSWRPMHAYWPG